MDEVEQRFVVKYFFLKGWGNKTITAELQTTFGDSAISNSTVKRWIRKFKNGDFSCDDDSRPGRPLATLGPALQKFLDRYPFASAKVISRHFRLSPPTVKEILMRELGLRKFSRRWVPHLLSDAQKEARIVECGKLLSMLAMYAEHDFEGIATGDESWFQYTSYSGSMFADSRESVTPRIRHDISTPKTMITIFFTSRRLLVSEALPKGTKFNQDYFIQYILPGLYREKTRISRKTGFPAFSVHMDNSMCHNGRKVSDIFARRSIERAPHPPHSPDISPCDFWLFGYLKHKMRDQEFRGQQGILNAIVTIWNDLTFEDVQRVFHEWMERLAWVIGNNGEYCPQ
jgi:histone-lysine N-methyltransferase SETMAR